MPSIPTRPTDSFVNEHHRILHEKSFYSPENPLWNEPWISCWAPHSAILCCLVLHNNIYCTLHGKRRTNKKKARSVVCFPESAMRLELTRSQQVSGRVHLLFKKCSLYSQLLGREYSGDICARHSKRSVREESDCADWTVWNFACRLLIQWPAMFLMWLALTGCSVQWLFEAQITVLHSLGEERKIFTWSHGKRNLELGWSFC